jgi:CRP/FNR family cyclic AMP-dependent transcriptional regulator
MSLVTSRLLAEIPLFSKLDEDERAELHSIMAERIFQPGQHMLAEGENGAAFYVIQQGEVEIWLNDTEGQKVVLDVLGPGKFFGELSMLSGETRSATATSTEEVITLELDRNEFFDFLRRRPDAAIDILMELGQKLKHTDDLLRTRVAKNPNQAHDEKLSVGQRVADLIADFSGSIAFLLINLIAFAAWIVVNTVGPAIYHFDA